MTIAMWNELIHNYRFQWPHILWLLPLPWLLMLMRGRRGGTPCLHFPGLVLVEDFLKPARNANGWMIFSLFALALSSGILALARPQKIKSHDQPQGQGISIMGTIDVSQSMTDTADFFINGERVNRLVVAKRYFTDFLAGRPNDRIGIVAFAGLAYLAAPITTDHNWLAENMDRVSRGLIKENGTAIGSAISTATRRLDKEKTKSKIIIILTDGASNLGSLTPQQAAKLAATLKIRIYSIAVGSKDGRMFGTGQQDFGETTLQEVADITGGRFFHAQSATSLGEVFASIDQLEKSQIESQAILETTDLYPWFLGASMALFGIWILTRLTLLPT